MNPKRLLLSFGLSTLAIAGTAFGDEIAVYKGEEMSSVTGEGQSSKTNYPQYLIVDFTTSQLTEIFLIKNGTQKQFQVAAPLAATQILTLDDRKPNQKLFSVFLLAQTIPNQVFSGFNTTCTEYRYLSFRGLNMVTTIGANQKNLPRVLSGILNDTIGPGMFTSGPNSGSPITSIDSETHGAWSLQKSITAEIEASGDTLDQAIQEVKTLLTGLHYTEIP